MVVETLTVFVYKHEIYINDIRLILCITTIATSKSFEVSNLKFQLFIFSLSKRLILSIDVERPAKT